MERQAFPIEAILYGDGEDADARMLRLARLLAAAGHDPAGLVQHNHQAAGRPRCDMELEELSTGRRIAISERRGPGARGCRLDHGALAESAGLAAAALEQGAGILILNRFGKVEAEGGGCRDLIIRAVELGVPVLLAVPWRNIAAFRHFAGGLAREHALAALPSCDADVLSQLGLGRRPLPGPAHHQERHA